MAKKTQRKRRCWPDRERNGAGKVAQRTAGLDSVTRSGVAQAINSALVLLYWQVGNRIRTETLKSERAAYGEQIVVTLSRQLASEFGHGFAEKNLRRHLIQLAELFPGADADCRTLSRQLGWSHFLAILPLKEALGTRFLRGDVPDRAVERAYVAHKKIGGMLFKTARHFPRNRKSWSSANSRTSGRKTRSPLT